MNNTHNVLADIIYDHTTDGGEAGLVIDSVGGLVRAIVDGVVNVEAPRADGQPRMTTAQRDRLWEMCGRYNVPFREDDYILAGKQASIGAGWVEGWVGGRDGSGITSRKTIYVGVSPTGESHT
jgi:hypothetical protein